MVWPGTAVKASSLSTQLQEGLTLAQSAPATQPPDQPLCLRSRLLRDDEDRIVVPKKGEAAAGADTAWGKLAEGAKARLVEATWKAEKADKLIHAVVAGQDSRIAAAFRQRLLGVAPDGKVMAAGAFEWAASFMNSDGDLPGVKGAGGYHEYYAEPDPGDPPSAGFWGQNRILHNHTSGADHSGSWWVTHDHYTNFVKVEP
ncbi:MAG: hypothetical protein NVSMB32_15340 [Actinomycetota bacterium]